MDKNKKLAPIAVIFDFDGVIVDSISAHLAAWDEACEELFGKKLDMKVRESIIGLSTSEISARFAAEASQPIKAQRLADLKRSKLDYFRKKIPLLPGVKEVFEYLTKQKIPFSIGSNATRAFISQICENTDLHPPVVVGIDDAVEPKPSPEIFLKCATNMGIDFRSHDQILVFEDSRHGINAANKAGMFAIGVASQHQPSYLIAGGARVTCRDLKNALDQGFFQCIPDAISIKN